LENHQVPPDLANAPQEDHAHGTVHTRSRSPRLTQVDRSHPAHRLTVGLEERLLADGVALLLLAFPRAIPFSKEPRKLLEVGLDLGPKRSVVQCGGRVVHREDISATDLLRLTGGLVCSLVRVVIRS